MSGKKYIVVLGLFVSLGSFASKNDCVRDCVSQQRDGNILLIKWVGTDGKTKKVFTVDLPADASEIVQVQQQDKSSLSTLNDEVAPDVGNAKYRVVTKNRTHTTDTEFVTVVTILTYGPGSSNSGGEVLIDVQVVESRVKRADQPEQRTDD